MTISFEAEHIAARLGVEITRELNREIDTYLLDDGRVMKLTSSMEEAAVADVLSCHGKPHAALPAYEAVMRFTSSQHVAGTPRDYTRYVIIRELLEDVRNAVSDEAADLWSRAAEMLGVGWAQNDFRQIQGSIELSPGRGLLPVYSALLWTKIHLGVDLAGIGPETLSKRADGSIVIRELFSPELPDAVLAKVRSHLIDEVPDEPALAPGF